MSLEGIADIALAVAACLGLIAAIVTWFYRRGAEERELTVAVRLNTTATDKLSAHMETITGTLGKHGERLAEHDARLKAGGL